MTSAIITTIGTSETPSVWLDRAVKLASGVDRPVLRGVLMAFADQCRETEGRDPTLRIVPEGSIVLTPDGVNGWEYTANALDYVANNYGDYSATLHWLALKIREQMTPPEPSGFGTMLRDDNGELWQRVTDTNTWFSRNYGGVRWGDPLIELPVEVVYQGEVGS